MPRPSRNANCHPDRKHDSLGLCKTCYANHKNNLNKEKLRLKAQEFRLRNKDKIRDAYFKKKFGISLEEYEQRKLQQDSKCAICRLKAYHLDHNHQTGALRMFLCYKCNTGIGYFNERTDLLKQAISYLESFS